jgi:polyribonucleotide nucleotidyltransferase
MVHVVTTEINGRTLSIETGRVANQAGGAVLVQYGETIVLQRYPGRDRFSALDS